MYEIGYAFATQRNNCVLFGYAKILYSSSEYIVDG